MYNAIHRVLFHEHHTAPHLLVLRQARQTNQQLQFLQQHLLPAEVAATQDDQQRGRGCGLPGKNPVAWEDLDPLIGLRDLFLQEIPPFYAKFHGFRLRSSRKTNPVKRSPANIMNGFMTIPQYECMIPLLTVAQIELVSKIMNPIFKKWLDFFHPLCLGLIRHHDGIEYSHDVALNPS